MLRPYQSNACNAALAFMRSSTSPCLIDAAPAAGKSHMIAHIADRLHTISGGKRILCLAPNAKLVLQNREKMQATGHPSSIFSASAGVKSTRHHIIFATPGTVVNAISRFNDGSYCAVVVDECFPAGTMVSTPKGDVPIEQLRNGDIVCNAVGSGVVDTLFCKQSRDIYDVKFSDGSAIECTGNHPFFTDNGWMPASDMEGKIVFRKQDVSRLFKGFQPEADIPQGEKRSLSPNGGSVGEAGYLLSILREEMDEPDALGGVARKNDPELEDHWTSSDNEDWKWHWANQATGASVGFARGWMAGGIRSQHEWRAPDRPADPLQDRYSQPINDDSIRSGRRKSRDSCASSTGQEERQILGWTRVESVTRKEQESARTVFNLHVTGHPSYYAGGVLVHNCHGMTPTVRAIIDAMREGNPNLRVLGLTGTPYVTGKGYIYRQGPDGRVNSDDTCRDPYFTRMVYRVSAREMLDAGYITPMAIGSIHADTYDTSGIHLLPNGRPNDADVERAFVGHGRKTAMIVADVVAQAQSRQGGVMLFAATIQHAREIMASLPPENSVLVTGDMSPQEEKAAVKAYRSHAKRYVVSVGKLTTGFDSPWTEIIAILRYIESATLLTQILGRAWRLYEGKRDCLLLDYAGNVERHFPDGDIYNPQIKAGRVAEKGAPIEATCPDCGYVNEFSANPDCADYKLSEAGYCLDVFGELIQTDFGPLSGHFGRRCNGLVKAGAEYLRCSYRWTSKECPTCQEPNDIAARRCCACKGEIVDPNEKLAGEFKAMKRDPFSPQTDRVLEFSRIDSVSRKGNPVVRAEWRTPWRHLTTWHQPEATFPKAAADWRRFSEATSEGAPETISYVKDAETGFFRVLAFNEMEDALP